MQEKIRVLIVDDHPFVRLGLSAVFEVWDDLELAGEARNGEEAIALAEQLQPDVVLMDLVMPVMDGIIATRNIRQKFSHIQVLVLTSTIEMELINQALEAGARGYLIKTITIDQLAAAIRSVVTS